jgi:hypothetical protein
MKRKYPNFVAKPLCLLVILSFATLDLSPRPVHAGMIETEAVVAAQADQDAREKVFSFLDREDAKQAMIAQGVTPAEVNMRVAALSDQEIGKLAAEIDTLPAGAGVGEVIGAVVFIFVLLLVTDILGLTKVFPFTRAIR